MYFGETIKYIKKNKLKIDKIIDVLTSLPNYKNDDISSISNSFSLKEKHKIFISYIFNKINPDAILIFSH